MHTPQIDSPIQNGDSHTLPTSKRHSMLIAMLPINRAILLHRQLRQRTIVNGISLKNTPCHPESAMHQNRQYPYLRYVNFPRIDIHRRNSGPIRLTYWISPQYRVTEQMICCDCASPDWAQIWKSGFWDKVSVPPLPK